MRESWDARSDLRYVDSRRSKWETDSFYQSGLEEAPRLLLPAFTRLGFEPAGKRILEIGCGPGRLFPGHAELFSEVWGIDVSPNMISQGEDRCPVPARFLLGNGTDLREVEDGSVDYCFSYLVFQHLPDEAITWSYFREMRRVLREGGCFQVQLLTRRRRRARVAKFLGARVPGDRRTWIGLTYPASRAAHEARALGFADVSSYEISASAYWLLGRQP